jgi:hypothetical protein
VALARLRYCPGSCFDDLVVLVLYLDASGKRYEPEVDICGVYSWKSVGATLAGVREMSCSIRFTGCPYMVICLIPPRQIPCLRTIPPRCPTYAFAQGRKAPACSCQVTPHALRRHIVINADNDTSLHSFTFSPFVLFLEYRWVDSNLDLVPQDRWPERRPLLTAIGLLLVSSSCR